MVYTGDEPRTIMGNPVDPSSFADSPAGSEARFRDLVENISDWIWEVDGALRYVYSSPKVRDILGYEPAEVLGKTPFDLMPAGEAARVQSAMSDFLSNPRPFRILENTNVHKDGTLRVLETSAVPLFDPAGNLTGFRGIDRDITARKEAERERERLIAALEDALAHIKTLRGLLPICASCKKIRDDHGYWTQVEAYLSARSDVEFTHSICPDCMKALYPGLCSADDA